MKRTIVNPVIKDVATFLQTARESNAKVSELEITLMPGGGNRLHYHKTYSETFVILEGELGVRLGKSETKILKPGERYTVLVQATELGTWVWHCHILPHAENENGMFGMVTALVVQ